MLPEDDAWVEGRSLVATVEDVELLDPHVSAEQLLYRLFHERGVRVFRSRDLHAQCSCSRAGVEQMLRSFFQGQHTTITLIIILKTLAFSFYFYG